MKNKAYTLRPKTANVQEITDTSKKTPGAGAYSPKLDTQPEGKYFMSAFRNSGATIFNPARSQRFAAPSRDKLAFPGPQSYLPRGGITREGSYFNSNYKNSKVRTFGSGMRKTLSQGTFLQTPGPGTYRLPSDFGYKDIDFPGKVDFDK